MPTTDCCVRETPYICLGAGQPNSGELASVSRPQLSAGSLGDVYLVQAVPTVAGTSLLPISGLVRDFEQRREAGEVDVLEGDGLTVAVAVFGIYRRRVIT